MHATEKTHYARSLGTLMGCVDCTNFFMTQHQLELKAADATARCTHKAGGCVCPTPKGQTTDCK